MQLGSSDTGHGLMAGGMDLVVSRSARHVGGGISALLRGGPQPPPHPSRPYIGALHGGRTDGRPRRAGWKSWDGMGRDDPTLRKTKTKVRLMLIIRPCACLREGATSENGI